MIVNYLDKWKQISLSTTEAVMRFDVTHTSDSLRLKMVARMVHKDFDLIQNRRFGYRLMKDDLSEFGPIETF